MDWSFNAKRIGFFLLVYLAIRVFSFYFEPATALYSGNIINNVAAVLAIAIAGYYLIKKPARGWSIVFLELILGGSGNFLALGGFALRSWLLVLSLSIFTAQKIKTRTLVQLIKKEKTVIVIFTLLYLFIAIAAVIGVTAYHDLHLILAQIVPYCFLLYYFPLKEQLANPRFREQALDGLAATLLGNTLFVLGTLGLFSSHSTALQDTYYHWFRDVAGGKITALPFDFYRIVLNEQLLLVPVLLIVYNSLIRQNTSTNQKKWLWMLIICCLLMYTVNVTRIDLIAVIIGYAMLFSKANWKRWLHIASLSLVSFILFFTAIHLVASRGQSLGWEIFGLRLQSIVSPALEDSSLSRLLTLPKTLDIIKQHPLLGAGLGTTISVYSPVTKTTIVTSDFDWGYLQMIAELGILGFCAWLITLGFIARSAVRGRLWRGVTAAFIALLIINLTSPALFNLFGCLFVAFLIATAESTAL